MRKLATAAIVTVMAIGLALGLVACGGATSSKEPVYVTTKQLTYDLSSGSVSGTEEWAYSSGNNTEYKYDSQVNGKQVAGTTAYSDFDQTGYPCTENATSGDNSSVTKSECTVENGRITKVTRDNGGEIAYTYHDNGQVKEMNTTYANGGKSLYEYDSDGYLLKNVVTDSKGDKVYTYMWSKDDKGLPTDYTLNYTEYGTSKLPGKYTVQCDDNGNIVRVYNSFGKLYKEYEYEKIESPSLYTWMKGHMLKS